MSHNVGPIRLTIPNAGQDSPALSSKLSAGQLKALLGTAVQIVIYTPSALTGTVNLQAVPVEGGSGWVNVQSPPGTDIALAANKAVVVNAGAFKDLRVRSSLAEAAGRDFDFIFQVTTQND